MPSTPPICRNCQSREIIRTADHIIPVREHWSEGARDLVLLHEEGFIVGPWKNTCQICGEKWADATEPSLEKLMELLREFRRIDMDYGKLPEDPPKEEEN